MRFPDGWLFTLREDKRDRTKVVLERTELVRCRNCRHYNTECYEDGFGWCHRRDFGTNDDWFCADGEKVSE